MVGVQRVLDECEYIIIRPLAAGKIFGKNVCVLVKLLIIHTYFIQKEWNVE